MIFDLFETLITESDTRPAGASSLGARLNLDPDGFRVQFRRRRASIVLGQMSFVDATAESAAALGATIDPSQLKELRTERLRIKAVPLMSVEAKILAMLDDLVCRGKRLVVISNCFAEDVAAWTASPLARRFHATVFSHQVGLAKPEPAIYLEACRRIDVQPHASVFIGDGESNELAGATEAGVRALQALWFLRRWPVARPTGGHPGLDTPADVTRLVC